MNWKFWQRNELVMERPIDTEIRQIKDMLKKRNHDEQKEIIAEILNWKYPSSHIHSNPRRQKQAQTEIAA